MLLLIILIFIKEPLATSYKSIWGLCSLSIRWVYTANLAQEPIYVFLKIPGKRGPPLIHGAHKIKESAIDESTNTEKCQGGSMPSCSLNALSDKIKNCAII